jgi:hypothetical protein
VIHSFRIILALIKDADAALKISMVQLFKISMVQLFKISMVQLFMISMMQLRVHVIFFRENVKL